MVPKVKEAEKLKPLALFFGMRRKSNDAGGKSDGRDLMDFICQVSEGANQVDGSRSVKNV